VRARAAALAATLGLLFAAVPATAVPAPKDSPRLYVAGEILVQFVPGISAEDRKRAVEAEGATIVEDVTHEGLVKIRLNGSGATSGGQETGPGDGAIDASLKSAIRRWDKRRDVEYAALNLVGHGLFVPNDTLLAIPDWTWNVRRFGAYAAWDVVRGADPSIVIAIVDTGVATESHPVPDYEKPSLWPGTQNYAQSPELPGPFLPGWDFVYDDAHPDDDHGHGTKIATVAVGAANNLAGSAGIAFGATILPIKVITWNNEAELDDVVQGIRLAADNGANIINLSLGLPFAGDLAFAGYTQQEIQNFFRPVRSAVNYAMQRGSIVVAAAGNDGVPAVRYPAAFPGVIAVGATGPEDNRASYSNFGKDLDFMAPGGDFTDLNGDHFQDQIPLLSIKPFRTEGSRAKPDSFIVDIFVGTSAAVPHICGAIALLMSQGVTKQSAIEKILKDSATYPDGLPRSQQIEYGNGFVHLDRAVQLAAAGNGNGPAAATRAGPGGALETRVLTANPARGEAALEFTVGTAGRVSARVFDARGRLVRTLFEGEAPEGATSLRWDGRDGRGADVPSGVYFLRIESPAGSTTHKVAFLR
jgi:serine protease